LRDERAVGRSASAATAVTDERQTGCGTRGGHRGLRGEAVEEDGARIRFRVGEVAWKTTMHRLAREKSLRKSAQSGLCDAKSDTPAESFF